MKKKKDLARAYNRFMDELMLKRAIEGTPEGCTTNIALGKDAIAVTIGNPLTNTEERVVKKKSKKANTNKCIISLSDKEIDKLLNKLESDEASYGGAMVDLESLVARCRKAISQNDLEGLKTFLRLNYPKKD